MKTRNSNFENEILSWVQKKKRIEGVLPTNTRFVPLADTTEFNLILKHLDYFVDNISYLNSRRSKEGFIVIESEADVQDLLFVMLKPSFPSMTYEDPSHKAAASYPIKDLYFPLSRIVLEAKYVYAVKDVKSVEKQLHDDIMKYSGTDDCDAIIFFIFDPNYCIPDKRTFIQKMSQQKGKFMVNGREITITTIIKPS